MKHVLFTFVLTTLGGLAACAQSSPAAPEDILPPEEARLLDGKLIPAGEPEGQPPAQSSPASRAAPRTIPGTDRVYEALSGSPGDQPRTPLCALLEDARASFGVYRVAQLKGRSEIDGQGVTSGVTYAELERVAGPGPRSATARIAGGPLPDGTDFFGGVSLARGQVAGLILRPAESDNGEGLYVLEPLDVFRDDDGVFRNGQHVVEGGVEGFLARAASARDKGCRERAAAAESASVPEPPLDGRPAVVVDEVLDEVHGEQTPLDG